jgi:hypothetical protein
MWHKVLLNNELAHSLIVAPALPNRTMPRDVRALLETHR